MGLMARLLDLIAAAADAWKLGALALILSALGYVVALFVMAIPVVLILGAAGLAFGFPISSDSFNLVAAIVAGPVGVGIAIPYLKEAVADFEARNEERRGRALSREAAKYRKAA